MEEKVAMQEDTYEEIRQEAWPGETREVLATVKEHWNTLYQQAEELPIVGETEKQSPEILARAWAFHWGLPMMHTLMWGSEKEKREKYLLAQAAKHVYAARHLMQENVAYAHYLWWCEELFPIVQRYCEHTEKREAQ